jgi:hypothetical protein
MVVELETKTGNEIKIGLRKLYAERDGVNQEAELMFSRFCSSGEYNKPLKEQTTIRPNWDKLKGKALELDTVLDSLEMNYRVLKGAVSLPRNAAKTVN